MRAQVLSRQPGKTQVFELPAGSADLGRESKAAVSLPLEGVSRRHARISFDGKHHWIEDLKSTNGTFLNGQSVQRERLRNLDVITLGKKVELLFLLRDAAHVTRKPGVTRVTLVPEGAELMPSEAALGEMTFGRVAACNVVIDQPAISKMHARIERTAEQVVLTDLESVNGTFVNGVRITTTVLRDGDLVNLAGAFGFRVKIETGEVVAAPAASADLSMFPQPAKPPSASGAHAKPRFSSGWKTRFDWDSAEREAIAAFQKQLAEEDDARLRARDAAKGPGPKPAPAGATPRPGAIPPTKPGAAPAAAKAAPAAATPKPPAAAAAPAKPAPPAAAAKPATPAPPPVPAAAAPIPVPPRPPVAAPAPPPSAPPPAPSSPPAASSTPEDGATILPGGARAAAMRATRVMEVRLIGGGFDVAAEAPGHHTLGRSSEVALRLNNATVSRQHARITIADDRSTVMLQDLGGANGTFLNGASISKIELLNDGDIVQLGDVVLRVAVRRE